MCKSHTSGTDGWPRSEHVLACTKRQKPKGLCFFCFFGSEVSGQPSRQLEIVFPQNFPVLEASIGVEVLDLELPSFEEEKWQGLSEAAWGGVVGSFAFFSFWEERFFVNLFSGPRRA